MQVSGLDQEFSELIESLPDSLFGAPDRDRLDPEFSRDPYTPLLALRDRMGPLVPRSADGTFGGVPIPNLFLYDETKPMFICLGYDAHMSIARDHETFANGHGAYGAAAAAVGAIPTVMDGPEHTRLRKLVMRVFNRPAVERRLALVLEPVLGFLIDRIEDRFAAGKPVDADRDLAVPLVYRVMSEFLGLPPEKFSFFMEDGAAMFNAPTNPERGMAAADRLLTFFREEVDKRRKEPREDVLGWMTEAEIEGEQLDDEEIAVLGRFLLPAGIETTGPAIALMIFTLLADRTRFDDVVADPTLIRAAVEESNRYAPSGFVVPRMAMRDVEICGVSIPAGSPVVSLQGIINRDLSHWSDPNSFDMRREHVTGHLTFNVGMHTCAGVHLAKAEMTSSLTALTERLPKLRLAVEPQEIRVEGLQIRHPSAVPLAQS
jgi:cytochrome P450